MSQFSPILLIVVLLAELAREEQKRQSPWLSLDEASDYARCSRSKIDQLIAAGKLARHKGHGVPVVRREDVDALIESKRR